MHRERDRERDADHREAPWQMQRVLHCSSKRKSDECRRRKRNRFPSPPFPQQVPPPPSFPHQDGIPTPKPTPTLDTMPGTLTRHHINTTLRRICFSSQHYFFLINTVLFFHINTTPRRIFQPTLSAMRSETAASSPARAASSSSRPQRRALQAEESSCGMHGGQDTALELAMTRHGATMPRINSKQVLELDGPAARKPG